MEETLGTVTAIQQIAQLPARYAHALDARDLDALLALFAGGDALREFFDAALRGFGRSVHAVSTQSVDLVDADHATGVAYCRAEHEGTDGGWFAMQLRYDDAYERRDGRWLFTRRRERVWWSQTIAAPDVTISHWPAGIRPPRRLPDDFPTWDRFWGKP